MEKFDTTPALLFNDIETGGLNGRLDNGKLGIEHYPIFELAFITTNKSLQEIGEPLELAVYQDEDSIAKSHKWALEQHTESGVIERSRQSKVTLKEAEQLILEHLRSLGLEKYNSKTKKGIIFAGSSCMFDRSYIMAQMKELHEFMHYRQLDVSALAIASRLWKPKLEKKAVGAKEYKHEALADIRETIEELKTYKSALFDKTDN